MQQQTLVRPKPIFGKLPQELYREIYDFDDTFHKVFSNPTFILEMKHMLLQFNLPVQYKFIQKLIQNINSEQHKECVKMYKTNGTPNHKQRLVPIKYKIEIWKSSLLPNFCNYNLTPINSMDTDYEHAPWYGCICDPTKLINPKIVIQYYLKMDIMIIPEISDTLVLYYDANI